MLQVRGLTDLSGTQKQSLMDAVPSQRKMGLISLALLALIFIGSRQLELLRQAPIYLSALGLVFVLSAVMQAKAAKQLEASGVPRSYVRNYTAARMLAFIGTMVVFVTLVF